MPQGVLFVHTNFPAQFRDLAQALVARGVPCCAIAAQAAPGLPGVRIARYTLSRGTSPDILPQAVRAEADLIRGLHAAEGARVLQAEGFDPQVIVGHPGWGETVLLDDVFPQARRVMFSEFFYHATGSEVDFDPEFAGSGDAGDRAKVKAKNAVMSLALAEADVIVAPTRFQADLLPAAFRERTRVLHEGIDVEAITPGPAEPFTLPDGRIIPPETPVITHVNRQLEPLRGMHIVARALPRLLAEVPDAQVLIFGEASKRAYGGSAPDERTWVDVSLQGVALDPARVHFVGRAPHDQMLAALRLSTAHVYYSYPFVLSWSLIEAMAAGCYVIGSDTAPVRDAIQDGVNGRLLPFFDVDALSTAMIAACRDPQASAPLRAAARETAVAQFSRDAGRAGWFAILREMGLEIPPA